LSEERARNLQRRVDGALLYTSGETVESPLHLSVEFILKQSRRVLRALAAQRAYRARNALWKKIT
jgi:hypothetical protein